MLAGEVEDFYPAMSGGMIAIRIIFNFGVHSYWRFLIYLYFID